jgi:hypothetical protein
MAASISFAFAEPSFRKSLQRRHHNRSIFNCNMQRAFFRFVWLLVGVKRRRIVVDMPGGIPWTP